MASYLSSFILIGLEYFLEICEVGWQMKLNVPIFTAIGHKIQTNNDGKLTNMPMILIILLYFTERMKKRESKNNMMRIKQLLENLMIVVWGAKSMSFLRG